MPILNTDYTPPSLFFRNGDVATLYAATLRKVENIKQQRERLELPDGDFLDLDWSFSKNPTKKCIIILHGLEGNAQRPYILGTSKIFNNHHYDCCAVNFRSCSGEKNRLYPSYHSGKTEDLEAVIQHILSQQKYTEIIIKGFSLGGNVSLKYVGEHQNLPQQIKAVIAISTPIDLEGCMYQLHRKRNTIYSINFLKSLKQKLREKQTDFPKEVKLEDLTKIKTLKDYDDVYTSKANGFIDAIDYYTKCSSKQFLKNIRIPTLIVNAKNDAFLSDSCYPTEIAKNSENIFLEMPKYGGHVGFVDANNIYYNEKRALAFVNNLD